MASWVCPETGETPVLVGGLIDLSEPAFDRAQALINIKSELEDFVTVDSSGAYRFNALGATNLARSRMEGLNAELLAAFGAGYYWLNTRFDIIYHRIVELHGQVEGNVYSGEVPDLAPYLAGLLAKSQAVSDYYASVAESGISSIVDANLASVSANIPPADDTTTETRFYRTTFVNDWENEGGPSEVSAAIEVGSKDTVTVTRGTVPSGRDIAYWRIYRSNVGSESAEFQYVPNASDDLGVAIASSTFVDDVPVDELNEVLPTALYLEPPAGMSKLVAMANGIHLGAVGYTLCPTPAFTPWAFPLEFRKTLEYEIVAMCAVDQAAFIGTKGLPYFVTGTDPATLSVTKLNDEQACVSAQSMCPTKSGPVYASNDGLCLATMAGVTVITAGLFTQEEWRALTPANCIVREHDGILYFGFIGGAGATYALNMGTGKLVTTLSGSTYSALHRDLTTDTLYGTADDTEFTETVTLASISPVGTGAGLGGGGLFTNYDTDHAISGDPTIYMDEAWAGAGSVYLAYLDVTRSASTPGVARTLTFYVIVGGVTVWSDSGILAEPLSSNLVISAQLTIQGHAHTGVTLGFTSTGNWDGSFHMRILAPDGATVYQSVASDPTEPGDPDFGVITDGAGLYNSASYVYQSVQRWGTPGDYTYSTGVGTGLFAYFQDDDNRLTGVWEKRIVTDKYETYGWVQIESSFLDADGVTAVSAVVAIYDSTRTLLTTVTVTSETPVRLAPFRERDFVLRITSAARITSLHMATSMAELQKQ